MKQNNFRLTGVCLMFIFTAFLVACSEDESSENQLLSFVVNTEVNPIEATINEVNQTIDVRVPQNVLQSAVEVEVAFSPKASVSPDFSGAVNLSSISEITVTAEDGTSITYTLSVEAMDEVAGISYLDGEQGSRWFGGDDRSEFGPRNVGSGQSIRPTETIHLTSFSTVFIGPFDFVENRTGQGNDVEVALDVRNDQGEVLASTTTMVSASFLGGFIAWDMSDRTIILQENTTYIFTWYLPDGFTSGLTASSIADINEGYAQGSAYGATITQASADISEWTNWSENTWDFWFSLGAWR